MSVPKLRFPEFIGEWEEKKLSELTSGVMYGLNAAAKDFDGVNKYIRITDIDETSNNFVPNPLCSPEGDLDEKFLLKENDLVFARTGASTGKSYLYNNSDGKLYFAGFLIKFHINKANSKFVFYNTLRSQYENWVRIMSVRSGQPGINAEEYKKLELKLPSTLEQQKIASFLSKVDEKIEKLEKKQELWETYKKGIMQQIFSQKLRFKDENGEEYPDWEEKKLGDIFDERNEKGFVDLQLLSVTLKKGVIKRDEIEGKDNSSENKSNYKRVMPNDIPYNSMRMWQGASGVSQYEGIVSPAYTVLIPNVDMCSKYFGYYFKTTEAIYQFKKYSQGLTSDTWNLKYPLLSEIKIKFPLLLEQEKIANFLLELDKKITVISIELNFHREFKKGLLQQMFC